MRQRYTKTFVNNYSTYILHNWIKKTIGGDEAFSLLELDWPGSKLISCKLINFLTHQFPSMSGKEPLFSKCLLAGMVSYKKSVSSDDPDRLCAFIDGLSRHLPEILAHNVRVFDLEKQSELVWNPIVNKPLICYHPVIPEDNYDLNDIVTFSKFEDSKDIDQFNLVRKVVCRQILSSYQIEIISNVNPIYEKYLV